MVGLVFPPPGAKACTAPATADTALAIASMAPPLAGCWAWGTWAWGTGDCGAETSAEGLAGWVAGQVAEEVAGEVASGVGTPLGVAAPSWFRHARGFWTQVAVLRHA